MDEGAVEPQHSGFKGNRDLPEQCGLLESEPLLEHHWPSRTARKREEGFAGAGVGEGVRQIRNGGIRMGYQPKQCAQPIHIPLPGGWNGARGALECLLQGAHRGGGRQRPARLNRG